MSDEEFPLSDHPESLETHVGEYAPGDVLVQAQALLPEQSRWVPHPDDVAKAVAYGAQMEEERERREADEAALARLTKEDWARLEEQRQKWQDDYDERARTPIMPEAPSEVSELLELDHTIGNFDDLHDVASALVATPMIPLSAIEEHTVDMGGDTEYREDVTIPMSRIVGIGTFETWAGRGFNHAGTGIGDKGGESSLTEVARCGRLGQMNEYLGTGSMPKLRLFEDADGEVWAYTYADGSHRTAGAKARGDKHLRHAIVEHTDRPLKVDFSVAAKLQEIKESGLVEPYGVTVGQYVDTYVAASEAFDAASPTAQRAKQLRMEREQGIGTAAGGTRSVTEDAGWQDDWV